MFYYFNYFIISLFSVFYVKECLSWMFSLQYCQFLCFVHSWARCSTSNSWLLSLRSLALMEYLLPSASLMLMLVSFNVWLLLSFFIHILCCFLVQLESFQAQYPFLFLRHQLLSSSIICSRESAIAYSFLADLYFISSLGVLSFSFIASHLLKVFFFPLLHA